MASRSFSKALRSPLGRQLASPAVQRRTFIAAMGALRTTALAGPRTAPAAQQVRGVKTMDFAGSKETVYGRRRIPRNAVADRVADRCSPKFRACRLAQGEAPGESYAPFV